MIIFFCDLHKTRIKETLHLYFDSSIEPETFSRINLHTQFVCTGFWTNFKGPFDDFELVDFLFCVAEANPRRWRRGDLVGGQDNDLHIHETTGQFVGI